MVDGGVAVWEHSTALHRGPGGRGGILVQHFGSEGGGAVPTRQGDGIVATEGAREGGDGENTSQAPAKLGGEVVHAQTLIEGCVRVKPKCLVHRCEMLRTVETDRQNVETKT